MKIILNNDGKTPKIACEQAHLRVTSASDEEQSDLVGRSLVKRGLGAWRASRLRSNVSLGTGYTKEVKLNYKGTRMVKDGED